MRSPFHVDPSRWALQSGGWRWGSDGRSRQRDPACTLCLYDSHRCLCGGPGRIDQTNRYNVRLGAAARDVALPLTP